MSQVNEYVPDPNDTEPLRRPATWTAIATAVIGLVAAFGLDLPPRAAAAALILAGTVGPLLVWRWGRRRAWSGATVADMRTRPASGTQPHR